MTGMISPTNKFPTLLTVRQSRALAAVQGGTDDVMFMVGTQSLKYTNQIHLLHLDEDTGALNKQVC